MELQDVDKLIEEIEKPEAPRAETVGDTQEGGATSSPEPKGWWESIEFDSNGKKVRPDSEDKARTWMAQGHSYSQRVEDLNRKQSEWQQKLRAAEENAKKLEQYKQIDDYAKSNPDWWKHVEGGWKSRETHQLDDNLRPVVEPILQRLQQTEGLLQEWQTAQKQEEINKADQALETEMESIRKQYPNIDLKSTNESGEPLELRVLKHANEIGTSSFRAAFRDYLHDELLNLAKADGREAIAKGQQQAAKKGIIGQTQAPVKGVQQATNTRGKSYSDLAQEALKEFGL